MEFSYFNHGTIIVPCFNLVLFFRVCRSTGIFHAFDFQKQSNRKTPVSDLELYKKVTPTQVLSCEFCKIELCTPPEDCFSFFDDYESFYFIQMTWSSVYKWMSKSLFTGVSCHFVTFFLKAHSEVWDNFWHLKAL